MSVDRTVEAKASRIRKELHNLTSTRTRSYYMVLTIGHATQTKNPKDIRACLDLQVVNKSMMRTHQVQAPITEDFI